MIRQIETNDALAKALGALPNDVFGGKLRALARAYGTGFPFLRFYGADGGTVIAEHYRSAVIAGDADEEIAEFCGLSGFRETLMSEKAYLSGFGDVPAGRADMMRYAGEKEPLPGWVDTGPSYEDFFGVIKDGFDIAFDEWYVETCHNVRHGISRLYSAGGAAAELMFAENGIALISFVCVKKEKRGTGAGKRLVRAISADIARENEVYIICRGEVMDFYRKADFVKAGNCYTVRRKDIGE